MDIATFFEEANDRSMAKARLVSDYFGVGSAAHLATGHHPIAYIESCAGPGRYQDGTESTPLLVLRQAVAWQPLADSLVSVFNDFEPAYAAALRQAIKGLPGVGRLRFEPVVTSEALSPQLIDQLDGLGDLPRLVFADPWGFTPFTGDLLGKILKNWSADLIFLFNFNRINLALGDEAKEPTLAAMFGAGNLHLLAGLAPADEFGVLVHELAHEVLHHGAKGKSRRTVELEAEAVAFVVTQAIGLDTNTAASDYIQLYHGNRDASEASLATIQRTASAILTDLRLAS